MTKTPEPEPHEAAPPPKRPYQKPTLIEYGPISKLTRSGGSTRSEASAPRMRVAPCL